MSLVVVYVCLFVPSFVRSFVPSLIQLRVFNIQGVHEEPDTLQIATVVKKKGGEGMRFAALDSLECQFLYTS